MEILIGGLVILVGLAMMNRSPFILTALACLGTLLLWGPGNYFAWKAISGQPLTGMDGLLVIDGLSGFFLTLLSTVGGAVLLNVLGDIQCRRERGQTERSLAIYLGLTMAFLLVMVLSLSSKNLGFIWVCIEGTTLLSALLIGFESHRSSLEAAWKYVVLCTVGLSCSLFGLILLVYAGALAGISGNLDPEILAQTATKMPIHLLQLSFIMLLAGFATKAGFAPLHSWLPDAYSQAPAPTSALLSGVLLNCSVYAILRAQTVMIGAGLGDYSRNLFLAFGICSLVLGTFFLLVQSDVKRMLAYSSIEHYGLMSLCLGIGTPIAAFAAALHMLGHSVAKALAFLSAGEFVRFFHSHEMNRMVGTIKRLPWGGGGLAVSMIALAGMPPFPLFFTELLLICAVLQAGKLWLAAIILLCIAVSFSGLNYQGTRILLGEDAHHHHHRHHSESPDHPEHVDVDHELAKSVKILAVGAPWRNASMFILTVILILIPLALLSPASQVLQRIGALMTGTAVVAVGGLK